MAPPREADDVPARTVGPKTGMTAMSPSAEPASTPIPVAPHLVPADLLADGEIFILAIKPSPWFVPLASGPVLAVAAAVSLVACVLNLYHPATPGRAIFSACLAVAVLRLLGASWQWLGRTYVLTNHRVAVVRGLIQPQVAAAGLAELRSAVLAAAVPERSVGVGSIYFTRSSARAPALVWSAVARPEEVHGIVEQAIRRAGPGAHDP